MDFKIIKYLIIFLLIQFNGQAIEFEGKFIQGHFILGKTDPRAKIQIDKKSVRVSKDGFFAFGLGSYYKKLKPNKIPLLSGNPRIVLLYPHWL